VKKKTSMTLSAKRSVAALAVSVLGAVGVLGASSLSASAATSTAASVKAIKADWVVFFNGKTPVKTADKYIQNGAKYLSILTTQQKTAFGSSASVKVLSVTDVTKSTAKVTYNILLNGTVALPNQKGVAVLQSGVWKVADTSFCSLLSLEGTKTKACNGL